MIVVQLMKNRSVILLQVFSFSTLCVSVCFVFFFNTTIKRFSDSLRTNAVTSRIESQQQQRTSSQSTATTTTRCSRWTARRCQFATSQTHTIDARSRTTANLVRCTTLWYNTFNFNSFFFFSLRMNELALRMLHCTVSNLSTLRSLPTTVFR